MWKEFTFRGTYNWIDILPKLLSSYNNTKHRTIQMKPVDVTQANANGLLEIVYRKVKVTKKRNKFKITDKVRISKYEHILEKGYPPNWTTEIFTVSKVENTHPVTYELTDYQNQLIEGGFYEKELTRVQYPDIYLVEKILEKRGNQVYVKWLGFGKEHNSWINKSDL